MVEEESRRKLKKGGEKENKKRNEKEPKIIERQGETKRGERKGEREIIKR